MEETKKIVKCLFDLNCSEKLLIEDLLQLNSLNHNEENLNQLIQIWNKIIDESLKNRQDMAININRTVTEPLKKIQIAFNEFKSAIKRYEQLSVNCNRYSQKLLEYQRCDRTSNVIVKQKRTENMLKQAQTDLETIKKTLERELSMFLQKRIEYFQPSLAAFICSGILYSGNNFSAMNQSELIFSNSKTERLEKQNELFKEIDNLSIISS